MWCRDVTVGFTYSTKHSAQQAHSQVQYPLNIAANVWGGRGKVGVDNQVELLLELGYGLLLLHD